ncbi:MAG: hypothetical protein ACMXYC_00475 [Candidatus Woesearchaeota archaeon]
MEVSFVKGYAIDQNVQCVINSANGCLIHDSGGAGALREYSRALLPQEQKRYALLLRTLPSHVRALHVYVANARGWEPRFVNLCALELLKKHKQKFFRGQSVYDTYWRAQYGTKRFASHLIHACCVSYAWKQHKRVRLRATVRTIDSALRRAFLLAISNKVNSIAVPVCCARKDYGIGPKQSLAILLDCLEVLQHTTVKKIIICFDNEQTTHYLNTLDKKVLHVGGVHG